MIKTFIIRIFHKKLIQNIYIIYSKSIGRHQQDQRAVDKVVDKVDPFKPSVAFI